MEEGSSAILFAL